MVSHRSSNPPMPPMPTHIEPEAEDADRPRDQTPRLSFASLALARSYIDTISERIRSIDDDELIDVLDCLDSAYDQFPELELDHPREHLIEVLRSAAENRVGLAASLILMYCIALKPSCPSFIRALLVKPEVSDNWELVWTILHVLVRSRMVGWRTLKPIMTIFQDNASTTVKLISEVLDSFFSLNEDSDPDLEEILKHLIGHQHTVSNGRLGLAEIVKSAHRRLNPPAVMRGETEKRAALLALAERFITTAPRASCSSRPVVGWASGRMSFDEFLLQWPCEIEMPADLADADFIQEAYRAILLREPDDLEIGEYLRLRRDEVSNFWILEDLLSSEELRSLHRRLRVVCGDRVITELGRWAEEKMPAVIWPSRSCS